MSTPSELAKSTSFEDILEGLQDVVEQLERGDLPLERSLQLFEQGMKLSRLGTQRLDEAESRVERLVSAAGTTEPFSVPGADVEPPAMEAAEDQG